MGVPEKEEEDQGIENLFEKIMKERLSSLIKENIQGTNSEGKETGTQIKDLEQKEEIVNQKRMNK